MEIPKTLKNLKGFLGLTSYYRKFIKNFDKIETPLRRVLKRRHSLRLKKQPNILKKLKWLCANNSCIIY